MTSFTIIFLLSAIIAFLIKVHVDSLFHREELVGLICGFMEESGDGYMKLHSQMVNLELLMDEKS